jgi:hypothetical protein
MIPNNPGSMMGKRRCCCHPMLHACQKQKVLFLPFKVRSIDPINDDDGDEEMISSRRQR